MGHKIKVRVNINGARSEKIGFSLDEGKSFRLSGKLPGMGILTELMAETAEGAELLQVSIKGGALVVAQTSTGPRLVLNGQRMPEAKIRKGDILTYENGKIEFLEAPLFVEDEASTRMVDLSQVDNATRVLNLEKLAQQTQKNDGATAFIMAEKIPKAKKPGYAGASSDNLRYEVESPNQGKTQTLTQTKPLRYRPASSHDHTRNWKDFAQHIGISLAVIGICGEVAAQIGFHFKYPTPPIETGYLGIFSMAVTATISAIFFYGRAYLNTYHSFRSYLRSFAWFSVYLMPFACSFAFPDSVVILAGILLGAIWIGLFAIKYFHHLPKFIPAAVAAWVAIFGVGFHLLAGHPARDVASAVNIDELTDKIEKMPITEASEVPTAASPAPVVAATIPSAVPLAKPATNQEITRQASNLALDPMAQEQFFNAVKSGNLKVVQSLVEKHVIDPVFTLDHGSSALHYAAAQGDMRLVQYLISKRVNVDAQDAGGTTPLMWAVYKQHPKVVDILLKKKVNVAIRREGGDRALEIAKNGSNKKILAMIRKAMQSRQIASLKNKKHKSKK
jgi:hypothetical protein